MISLSLPPTMHDAGAVHDVPDLVRRVRGVGAPARDDEVAGDRRVTLRCELLDVEAVRHDAGAVVAPDRVDDEQVAARVRARVAELVVLGRHVGDDRVAGIALPDVEARVGAARRVRVIEHAPLRVEREDAVVAVAVRGEVRAAIAVHAVPEEAVLGVVPRGEVLDRDAVGADDLHAVLALEVAVEDRAVAVDAAEHDARWSRP